MSGNVIALVVGLCALVVIAGVAAAYALLVRAPADKALASDLGAEKFFDIKCRIGGLKPSAVVIVATEKAIEYHGGFKDDGGSGNLLKHIENMRAFGLEPVVAVNRFPDDTVDGLARILDFCERQGVRAAPYEGFARGVEGAVELAGFEDLLDVLMTRRRRGANSLQEAIHPVGCTGGAGEPNEDRSFQLLVRRQPLLDIAVRTKSDVEPVALW